MVRYENQCVQCPKELGCRGEFCPKRNVPIWICDECKEESVDLWDYDGQELCRDCLLKIVPKAHTE